MIFMDTAMSGMNGVDTSRRIREIRPKAAAILMTAYAVHGLIREALREGAYRVVYKPLDIPNVLAVIEGASKCVTLA